MGRRIIRLFGFLAALIIFGSGASVLNAGTRVFEATDTPLPIPLSGTSGQTLSEIVVEESCVIGDLNVTVDITHTYDGDLILSLGGGGAQVVLSNSHGGRGNDYQSTTFDDEAGTPIGAGSPPFIGTFSPEQPLTSFDGENAQGNWTLTIDDQYNGDSGILYNWSITVECLGPDKYLSYPVQAEKKFDKVDVALTDQFQSGTFTVEQRKTFLTPANMDGEGISDSETHLLGYKIRSTKSGRNTKGYKFGHKTRGSKFCKVPNVLVEDQFGAFYMDLERPEELLVPAAQSLIGPGVSAPSNDAHDVNSFLCYKVKISRGEPEFQPIWGVSLADQFEKKIYDIVKPERLCTPVDLNGDGIKTSDTGDDHLLCYEAEQAPFLVSDQFGPGQVDGKTKRELCVPASISID